MQEMIPFVGPQTDIMGPDMGTNEQVMAWFMDTYSVYHGYAVNEIVTGKPVAIGGTEGRREVDRSRRRLFDRARDEHVEDGSGKMHRDRAGIRKRRLGGGAFACDTRAASRSSESAMPTPRFTIRRASTSRQPNSTS